MLATRCARWCPRACVSRAAGTGCNSGVTRRALTGRRGNATATSGATRESDGWPIRMRWRRATCFQHFSQDAHGRTPTHPLTRAHVLYTHTRARTHTYIHPPHSIRAFSSIGCLPPACLCWCHSRAEGLEPSKDSCRSLALAGMWLVGFSLARVSLSPKILARRAILSCPIEQVEHHGHAERSHHERLEHSWPRGRAGVARRHCGRQQRRRTPAPRLARVRTRVRGGGDVGRGTRAGTVDAGGGRTARGRPQQPLAARAARALAPTAASARGGGKPKPKAKATPNGGKFTSPSKRTRAIKTQAF